MFTQQLEYTAVMHPQSDGMFVFKAPAQHKGVVMVWEMSVQYETQVRTI